MKVTKEKERIEPVPVAFVQAGSCFTRNNSSSVFIRLKPTAYLLNSSMITDCLNRRKALIADLEKGTTYFIEGEELVWPTEAELIID